MSPCQSLRILAYMSLVTHPKYKNIPVILGDCKNKDIEKLALKCGVPFNGVSFFYQTFQKLIKNNYTYSNEEINLLISEIQLKFLD